MTKGFHMVSRLALLIVLLAAPAALAERVPLGELEINSAVNNSGKNPRGYQHRIHGWRQQMFIDKTPEDKPLTVGDATFERGFFITDARKRVKWTYELDGKYLSLTGYVGTTNGEKDGRTSSLEVEADGEIVYQSGPLQEGKLKPVFVDLRGVKELKLLAKPMNRGVFKTLVFGSPVVTRRPELEAREKGDPGDDADNQVPQVVIESDVDSGRAPLKVEFNSEKSNDPDGKIMRYTWHFGDGETNPLDFNATHTYDEPGIYEVAVVAEDDDKGRGVARKVIMVKPAENQEPRASWTSDRWLVKPGDTVQLDASESYDRDGRIASYRWTFPDGSTAQGAKVSKTFDEMGIKVIELTVEDADGGTDTARRRVRVDDGSNTTVFPLREGSRVLFIGNSLLGGLRQILPDMARAAGFEFTYGSAGKGGGKVDEYVEYEQLKIRERIMQGWDIVIIQPWGRPYQDDWETAYKPYARTLVEWVREGGAYPVFLEPHRSNRGVLEGQSLGRERIGGFAKELGAGYIPAGQAWQKVAQKYPPKARFVKDAGPDDIGSMLYADGIHQNKTGQLLTAMVIWEYLTGEPATEMKLPEEWSGNLGKQLNHDLIPYLREVAAEVGKPAEPLQKE
jgi:PKD repeat protein